MATIYEIYNRNKTKDRDALVIDRINHYMRNNITN